MDEVKCEKARCIMKTIKYKKQTQLRRKEYEKSKQYCRCKSRDRKT